MGNSGNKFRMQGNYKKQNSVTYNNENEKIFQRSYKTTLIKYTEELNNGLLPNFTASFIDVHFANQDNEKNLTRDHVVFEHQLK